MVSPSKTQLLYYTIFQSWVKQPPDMSSEHADTDALIRGAASHLLPNSPGLALMPANQTCSTGLAQPGWQWLPWQLGLTPSEYGTRGDQ